MELQSLMSAKRDGDGKIRTITERNPTLYLKCTLKVYYESAHWNSSRKTLNNINPNTRARDGGIEGL